MNRSEINPLLLLPFQNNAFFNGAIATIAAVLAVQLFTSSNPMGSTFRLLGQFRKQVKTIKSFLVLSRFEGHKLCTFFILIDVCLIWKCIFFIEGDILSEWVVLYLL